MSKSLEVVFSRKAERWLRHFNTGNPKAAKQIAVAIITYAKTRANSVAALRGSDDHDMRIRVRTWRVIFRVDERRQAMYVVDIGNRGDIYRRWGRR